VFKVSENSVNAVFKVSKNPVNAVFKVSENLVLTVSEITMFIDSENLVIGCRTRTSSITPKTLISKLHNY
jgi:hypothetical protein